MVQDGIVGIDIVGIAEPRVIYALPKRIGNDAWDIVMLAPGSAQKHDIFVNTILQIPELGGETVIGEPAHQTHRSSAEPVHCEESCQDYQYAHYQFLHSPQSRTGNK